MTNDTEPRVEPQLRLFVAATLPEAWIQGLGGIQDEMRQVLEPEIRLRYVKPEGIHLTLKFIGEVSADMRPAIEAGLAHAITQPLAIPVDAGWIRSFGHGRILRVIWLGMRVDGDALANLARQIDQGLHALGFPLQKQMLEPHLTIARVPDGLPPEGKLAVEGAMQAAHVPELPRFVIRDVALISSKLGPGGARYEVLARFPLTPDTAPSSAAEA